MGLLSKRIGRVKVDRRQSLAGIPFLNEAVIVENVDNGRAVLHVEQRRGEGFLERFRPPKTTRNYKLDEFGAFVVNSIDNEKTVQEIVTAFSEHFGLTYRESELGVAAFIKMLMKRNLLAVGIPN
jgi:hypothetical protein